MSFFNFLGKVASNVEHDVGNVLHGDSQPGGGVLSFLSKPIDAVAHTALATTPLGVGAAIAEPLAGTAIGKKAANFAGNQAVDLAHGVARVPANIGTSAVQIGNKQAQGATLRTAQQLQDLNYGDRVNAIKTNPGLSQMLKDKGFNINDPSDSEIAKLSSDTKQTKDVTYTPGSTVEKIAFGKEPVQSYQQRAEGNKQVLEGSRFRGVAGPLSFLAGAATLGGDVSNFTGGGAEKQASEDLIKNLAQTTTTDGVKKLLADKVAPDIADKIAPAISKTKDPNIIQNIIDKVTQKIPESTPGSINVPIDQLTAHEEAPNRAVIDGYKARINAGVPIDSLKVTPDSTGALGVEDGKHRLQALTELGYTHAPVEAATKEEGVVNPELKAALDNVGNKSDIAPIPTQADVAAGTKAKEVGQSVRQSFIGELDAQRLAGTHFNEALKNAAPDEQGAIFWYREANGDTNKLQAALSDPKFAQYHDDIQKALNLSPGAKDAAKALDQAYQKTGEAAAQQGTIKGALQSYGNSRFYVQEPQTGNGLSSTLRQGTSSAKSRTFTDAFDAVNNGKQFATTNAADAFALHNSELARVNTTRNLLDTMQKGGLGKWTTGAPPEGWTRVEGITKTGAFNDANGVAHASTYNFVAPKEIADRMAAITKTDALKRSGFFRSTAAYQGLVKTLDLSFSLFHHLTTTIQTLSQTKLGYDVVKNWDKIGNLDSSEFRRLELQAVKDGNIRTTEVAGNQDISKSLFSHSNQAWADTVKEAPGVKQVLGAAHASSSVLFDKMQRYLKVMDWHGKMEKWIASNPQATQEEYLQAARGYGKEVNAAYGGLNWEALGITKTQQSILRTVLLAPDWFISNASLLKYVGVKGVTGQAARAHVFTALAAGMLGTEVINKAVTGHFTNQNQKGHEFEIELAPGTHISLIRGGPGELLNIFSKIRDKGPLTGTASYLQGKESPFARTLTGLLSNVNYFGQSITNSGDSYPQKLAAEGKFVASNLLPVPFGAQGGYTYVKDALQNHQHINPAAVATTATGLARFTNSQPGVSKPDKQVLNQLRQEGASPDQVTTYQKFFETGKGLTPTDTNKKIDVALKAGNYDEAYTLAKDYNDKVQKAYGKWVQDYGSKYGSNDLYSRYQQKFINPDGFDQRLENLTTPLLSK